jgi:hypothetical protein
VEGDGWVAKEDLVKAIWGDAAAPSQKERTLRTHITQLRKLVDIEQIGGNYRLCSAAILEHGA